MRWLAGLAIAAMLGCHSVDPNRSLGQLDLETTYTVLEASGLSAPNETCSWKSSDLTVLHSAFESDSDGLEARFSGDDDAPIRGYIGEAFLMPSGSCLVQIIAPGYVSHQLVVVLELERIDEAWVVRRVGMHEEIDLVDGLTWWISPLHGAVALDSSPEAGELRLRLLLTEQRLDGENRSVRGYARLVLQHLDGQLPESLDVFLREARLSEDSPAG